MANDFKNQGAALTTGGASVYSAPTGAGESAIIHSMIISNIDGTNSANVDIKARATSGDTYFHVAKGVPVGGAIEHLDDGTLFSAFKNRSPLVSD